jgi:dTDP-glucose pyrophosphorylase
MRSITRKGGTDMKDWKKALIAPSLSIRATIETIDTSALQIGLVVNEQNVLLGTVTDGDIRRGILKGLGLDDSVQQIMNTKPTTAHANDGRESILTLMKSKSLHQIPVLDNAGCIVSLEILDDLIQSQQHENAVVLMAGGLGSRLQPLTNDCPKPLLKVSGKPILEIILENFIEHGFKRFYVSVNYRAEMIENYFGDGTRWGVQISYLRESERRGTAGALSLLIDKQTKPLIVMNGDLLTRINFRHLLSFHAEHQAMATMCVRDYDFQVPYGVVKIDKYRLIGIEEKPVHHFFVSAGIYVLEPDCLSLIPAGTFYDMPDLFAELIRQKKETAVFPIREYWLDIGRMDDFERAVGEYERYF